MEPVPAEGLGGLTRRPGRSGRVVAALGVVLAVLMGSLTTTTSPVAATGGPSYSILATVTVGADPYGVAVSPDGARVYVTVAPYYEEDPIPGTVKVINTSNNTVVATVPVGFGPSGVAVSPNGSRVYVTNSGSGSVSVIDTSNNTVVATVPVG
jgi:YVTN family beta-propeller protein